MPCWGLLGFTSGQTLFPWAVDPCVSCAKGSREGDLSPSSTFPARILGVELIPSSESKAALQGRDGAQQTTLFFAAGQEGGGNHEVWPYHRCLPWAVFPQATTHTATI